MSRVTWVLILTGVGFERGRAASAESSHQALGALQRVQCRHLNQQRRHTVQSLPFWTGMLCYAASVCVWVAALSKAPVSTAYPMLSLGYVVVAAVSVAWLGETLTPAKMLGIALICTGVVLVSRSSI